MGCCSGKKSCQISADVADSVFTLHFGPGRVYNLSIPATNQAGRKAIATQLRQAADQLEQDDKSSSPEQNASQMSFPFVN